MTKLSIATTVATLILLTSISGGRFEPPTVFAVRLNVYYSILVEICQTRKKTRFAKIFVSS